MKTKVPDRVEIMGEEFEVLGHAIYDCLCGNAALIPKGAEFITHWYEEETAETDGVDYILFISRTSGTPTRCESE